MLFTRWKLLTGALGMSLGGWATFGGTADQKVDVPPPPVVAPATPVAPLAVASATPLLPTLPAIPAMPPAALPSSPVIELPGLPLPDTKPIETKLPPKPTTPVSLPVVPASGFELPPSPVALPSAPPSLPPMPTKPAVDAAGPFTPPLPSKPPAVAPESPMVEYTKPATPSVTPVAALPSKFRIVLRVGAGDPSFEVRHDDDLVMKVVCEKVDIKSPEKGQGPSNVIATGKVRFVGFGAEGTCDSFSFLAGTGEVALAGNVNVKVRDKIGRVESELNADKMQYKLDQTALTGVLKP